MKKPVIGINLDHEESGEYSDYPFYALRKNYFDAVSKAGGIAIGIPYDMNNLGYFIDTLDGILIPGGHFDIPTEYYSKEKQHSSVKLKPGRSEFEFSLIRGFLEQDKPILGICGGMQVIAVELGATLYQDIATEAPDALNHEVKDRESSAHKIIIEEGSLLHKIVKRKELGVNTSHHQAAKSEGKNLIASAKSEDGIIEAVESKRHKFCLGLQWHPEYLIHKEELEIFKAFIDSCK
jgi:putative glutamine amidotransferase